MFIVPCLCRLWCLQESVTHKHNKNIVSITQLQTLHKPASHSFLFSRALGAGRVLILRTEVKPHQRVISHLPLSLCVCCTHISRSLTPTTLPATAASPKHLQLLDRRGVGRGSHDCTSTKCPFGFSFGHTTLCRSHTPIGRDFSPPNLGRLHAVALSTTMR